MYAPRVLEAGQPDYIFSFLCSVLFYNLLALEPTEKTVQKCPGVLSTFAVHRRQ